MATRPTKSRPPYADAETSTSLLEDLQFDLLGIVAQHLRMDAFVLRQTCKTMAALPLTEPMRLAHRILRTKPSVPIEYLGMRATRRRPLAACYHITWTEAGYWRRREWRPEWAALVALVEQVPTNTLIDAFLLLPASPPNVHDILAARATFGKMDWEAASDARVQWNHARRVVRFVLEDRLWMLCCSKDVFKNANGDDVVKPMRDTTATRLVSRLVLQVRVHNGSTSFFHTMYGWLQFTPFLLAAERSNLPLVKWLHRVSHPINTIDARSQAGNSAYSLCLAELKRTHHTPEQIRASETLRFLASISVPELAPRDEYVAYEDSA